MIRAKIYRMQLFALIFSKSINIFDCEWVEIPQIKPPLKHSLVYPGNRVHKVSNLLENSNFLNRVLPLPNITRVSTSVPDVFSGIVSDVDELRSNYVKTTGSTQISDKIDFTINERFKNVKENSANSQRGTSNNSPKDSGSAEKWSSTSAAYSHESGALSSNNEHSGEVEEVHIPDTEEENNDSDYVVEDYDEELHGSEKVETNSGKPAIERRVIKIYRVKPKFDEVLTLSNFLKFLKGIQENFMNKTKNGINDKIQVLNNFKNELLLNIKTRIGNLWTPGPSRKKRGIMGYDHHEGLDFPSAEGALLTISFLTFAVFLIKLVLQVIKTVKSKHYSYNGIEATQLGAVKIIKKNRNARRLSYSDTDIRRTAGIIQSVERIKLD